MSFWAADTLDMSSPAAKQEGYALLLAQTRALIDGERNMLANLAQFSALVYNALPELNWAGFYLARGEQLLLGPFQGKVACVRIPFGRGVCGSCAASGRAQLVPDVHAFPGHIACDSASNSELVLPLLKEGRLLGVLDLDSPRLARFDADDAQGLTHMLDVLAAGTDWTHDEPAEANPILGREPAARLCDVYQRAFDVLCEAYEVLGSLPEDADRDAAMMAHGKVTDAVLFGLRAKLLAQHPDLATRPSEAHPEEPFDPLADLVDEALDIDAGVLRDLADFRTREKFNHLPGVDTAAERERLLRVLDELTDRLLEGIRSHPTKLWVMQQFQRSLVLIETEDTEGKEHVGMELESLMAILGIESSDGLLNFYLGGI